MKTISTKKAPAAIGPYSQAVQIRNLVYTSGFSLNHIPLVLPSPLRRYRKAHWLR